MIVAAPAKINLTLEVVGVEPNGYHLLDSVFCWLELEDTLNLEKTDTTELVLTSDEVGISAIEVDESNLAMKALRAVEKSAGRELPTRIELHKRIPSGGGLGGGSADAAAVIFGLNILHDLRLSQEQMLELARPLGADVAFGLVGGAARGTRYGDMLEPVEIGPLWERDLLLVMPPFGCPTPAVYRLWDKQPSHVAQGASQRFLANPQSPLESITNDLEEPAFHLHPRLRDYKKAMLAAGLEAVTLSGSGSTLFGFVPVGAEAEDLMRTLSPLGVAVRKTRLKESTRFGLVF